MFWLKDRTVLITGGTGSFGQKCAAHLLRHARLKRLIIFSRDEQKHVAMQRGDFSPEKNPELRYFIGDVRDAERLRRALRGVDFVIHAAAMKHVDMAEYNPQECIQTNIGGAENLINACLDSQVQKVVALSTDKAANPINLYGATKLCSDKLFVAANSLAGESGTRFAVVRYGNVLGSNGSVVPFFQQERIKGVLPITHPDMTRFIITLDEGVALVIKAFERMAGGEIYVPKIPSTTIMEIARAVAPECRSRIVGIRPGEKMHECMIPVDEARQTLEFDDHFVIQPVRRSWTRQTPKYVSEGRPCPDGFCYSSDTNPHWLSPSDLVDLINAHSPSPSSSIPTLKVHAA